MSVSQQRARLDAEFKLDRIADLDALFRRRAKAAEAAFERFEAKRDVRYGPRPEETLILFPATGASGSAPVQVFVHGGFWSSLAARDFAFVAAGFAPFGAALAVIDYPLIPAVRMSDVVTSCLRAVAFLRRGGASLGVDPERIFLSGNSAGGHLVAEAMDGSRLAGASLGADAVKGGTAISGLYDLAPVAASFRNELLQFTADEVAAFSPLNRPASIAAPLIVAVGGDETGEFLDQSERFAAHVEKGGAPVAHMVVPGADHITVVLDAFAEADAPLNRAVRRQMGLG
jgi:arylformamidase